jgi:heme exporter protein CcmD
MDITRFMAMGGYAVYVWPSYLLAALVIGFNIISARRVLRLAQRDASRRLSAAKVAASP